MTSENLHWRGLQECQTHISRYPLRAWHAFIDTKTALLFRKVVKTWVTLELLKDCPLSPDWFFLPSTITWSHTAIARLNEYQGCSPDADPDVFRHHSYGYRSDSRFWADSNTWCVFLEFLDVR